MSSEFWFMKFSFTLEKKEFHDNFSLGYFSRLSLLTATSFLLFALPFKKEKIFEQRLRLNWIICHISTWEQILSVSQNYWLLASVLKIVIPLPLFLLLVYAGFWERIFTLQVKIEIWKTLSYQNIEVKMLTQAGNTHFCNHFFPQRPTSMYKSTGNKRA